MKIIHFNKSDIQGGAARAAYRIHHALRKADLDSVMQVDQAVSGDWTVQAPKSLIYDLMIKCYRVIAKAVCYLLITGNPIIHSPAIFSPGRTKKINQDDVDIVHLHWVQGEMLSIAEIGNINKPIVWTLHDMWAFCGAEHYTEDERYLVGYEKQNRPAHEQGFDLNRWAWQRKRKLWKNPSCIVTPSQWLADCAKKSYLMKNWPISVIPNAIDTESWRPIDKLYARSLLSLPSDKKLLLFGAMGGGDDPRKGFDLLLAALQNLKQQTIDIELIIFGQLAPKNPPDLGFPIHYMGHLHDDISLRLLYSAADIMLIPSRQDNLPNTGVESLACGTPIVAFNTCGLPDIVQHQQTGYLAEAFDTNDLSMGIQWILQDQVRYQVLSRNSRQYAVEHFSYNVVAEQYKALYKKIIGES